MVPKPDDRILLFFAVVLALIGVGLLFRGGGEYATWFFFVPLLVMLWGRISPHRSPGSGK